VTIPNSAIAHTIGYTDGSGNLPTTLVWNHRLQVGDYDIWVDSNQSGTLDLRDAFSDQAAGASAFRVVLAPRALTITISFASAITESTPVIFTANVTGGRTPYAVSWLFGDGSSTTGFMVAHTYHAKGTYSVIGSVRDAFNATTSSTVQVKVGPKAIVVQAGIPWTYVGLGGIILIGLALVVVVPRLLRKKRPGRAKIARSQKPDGM